MFKIMLVLVPHLVLSFIFYVFENVEYNEYMKFASGKQNENKFGTEDSMVACSLKR